MANPPPVRPWFRLGSIRSGPAPAPTPAPAPAPVPEVRPIVSLPTFRTASAPPSPQVQPTQPQEQPHVVVPSRPAPSSSLPTSPIQKTAFPDTSSVPYSPSRKSTQPPSPTHSPRTIKASVQSPRRSPKTETTAPPPSPLTLPPSQMKTEPKIPMEAEPKTVLIQKTVEKPDQWLNGSGGGWHRETGETRHHGNGHHGKHLLGKEGEAKEKGIHRKVSDSEEYGMRVITIAGENRGAYMELVQSPKKHEPNSLHKKGHSKNNVEGGESESSSSEEGKISKKDKHNKGRTTSSIPMAAYMNSNVQCVNNSLLYHTSCSHHDPGVRLSLSKKPSGEGYHLKEHVDDQNT